MTAAEIHTEGLGQVARIEGRYQSDVMDPLGHQGTATTTLFLAIFSLVSQRYTTPYMPCDILHLVVPMLIGCCLVFAIRCWWHARFADSGTFAEFVDTVCKDPAGGQYYQTPDALLSDYRALCDQISAVLPRSGNG